MLTGTGEGRRGSEGGRGPDRQHRGWKKQVERVQTKRKGEKGEGGRKTKGDVKGAELGPKQTGDAGERVCESRQREESWEERKGKL